MIELNFDDECLPLDRLIEKTHQKFHYSSNKPKKYYSK